MKPEDALKVADEAVNKNTGKHLTDIQERILKQSWDNKTYEQIALAIGYDSQHVKNEGSQLWQILTDALGEKVSKSNFRASLERYKERSPNSNENSVPPALPVSPTFRLSNRDRCLGARGTKKSQTLLRKTARYSQSFRNA